MRCVGVSETLSKQPGEISQEIRVRRLAEDRRAAIGSRRASFRHRCQTPRHVRLELLQAVGGAPRAPAQQTSRSATPSALHMTQAAPHQRRRCPRSAPLEQPLVDLHPAGRGRRRTSVHARGAVLSNHAAIAMYERSGFRSAGLRPATTTTTAEDAPTTPCIDLAIQTSRRSHLCGRA